MRMSDELLADQLELTSRYIGEELILTVKYSIWSGSPKYIKYDVPATWWDMFKEQHFPNWLKNKFPPCYSQEAINVIPYFPDLKLIAEKYNCTILFKT